MPRVTLEENCSRLWKCSTSTAPMDLDNLGKYSIWLSNKGEVYGTGSHCGAGEGEADLREGGLGAHDRRRRGGKRRHALCGEVQRGREAVGGGAAGADGSAERAHRSDRQALQGGHRVVATSARGDGRAPAGLTTA